jgi:hypothetical protein
MSLDEVLEKTTIEFPRPINREEAEKLLLYIAKNLQADVRSIIKYRLTYYHDEIHKYITEDGGTLRIDATVSSLKTPALFDSFHSEPHERDRSYISEIVFGRVPGWELANYGEEKVKFWDDVRVVVNKYFKEFPRKKGK